MAIRSEWSRAPEASQWVAQRIPNCERGFGACLTLLVYDGDDVIAGVVFSNWSPTAGVIEMHGAATHPKWLTRPVLRAIHEYVFSFCQMAVMRTSENNARVISAAKRFGYEAQRIPRLRGRDEDEIVLTLTDECWREKWGKDGFAETSSAA